MAKAVEAFDCSPTQGVCCVCMCGFPPPSLCTGAPHTFTHAQLGGIHQRRPALGIGHGTKVGTGRPVVRLGHIAIVPSQLPLTTRSCCRSGGGKGVIVKHPGTDVDGDPVLRRALFEDYGKFLTSLQGCYVAAEDAGDGRGGADAGAREWRKVAQCFHLYLLLLLSLTAGTFVHDVDVVFEHTRYTTCISPSLGGSGNPSVPTAAGVVAAMQVLTLATRHDSATNFVCMMPTTVRCALLWPQGAVDWLGPPEGLQGRTVAIQGVGNVGRPLIKFLLEKGEALCSFAGSPFARVTLMMMLMMLRCGGVPQSGVKHIVAVEQDEARLAAVSQRRVAQYLGLTHMHRIPSGQGRVCRPCGQGAAAAPF